MTPDQFRDLLIRHLTREGKWEFQADELSRISRPNLVAMQEAMTDLSHDLYRGLLLTQRVQVREAENFKADFNEAFAAAKRGWEP